MGICKKNKINKRLRRQGEFSTLSAKFHKNLALTMLNWGKEKRETLTTMYSVSYYYNTDCPFYVMQTEGLPLYIYIYIYMYVCMYACMYVYIDTPPKSSINLFNK